MKEINDYKYCKCYLNGVKPNFIKPKKWTLQNCSSKAKRLQNGSLLLGIFINNNFSLISNNNYVFNKRSIVYNPPNILYYNINSFLESNYSKVFNDFDSLKPLYV